MKKIVTISREFGAGGGTIGYQLAQKTGFEYYDKELILMMAGKSHIDIYELIKWDEKLPINFGFTQSLFDFYNRPVSEQIFQLQSEVITQIAEKGNCIIVGRNANSILQEYDHTLHVFIHADFQWRLNRMHEKMPDLSTQKLTEELHTIDKKREKYCSFHTSNRFGDAKNYDLCLDSSRLGIDTCVKILEGLVE